MGASQAPSSNTLSRSRPTLLRVLGGALAIGALWYFFVACAQSANDPKFAAVLQLAPRYVLLTIVVFFICNTLGALGWSVLVRALMVGRAVSLPLRPMVVAYYLSVVAKYLPGNVGHFIGRGVLAKRLGVSFKTSAVSFLLESATLLCVALLLSLSLVSSQNIQKIAGLPSVGVSLQNVWSVVLGLAVFTAIAGFSVAGRYYPRVLVNAVCRAGVVAGLGNAISLVLLGILTLKLMPEGTLDVWSATGMFSLAFLAGFVIPGAPAGIGVREAVFVSLAPEDAQAAAVAVIGFFRLTQVFGDALTFVIALVLRRVGGYCQAEDAEGEVALVVEGECEQRGAS